MGTEIVADLEATIAPLPAIFFILGSEWSFLENRTEDTISIAYPNKPRGLPRFRIKELLSCCLKLPLPAHYNSYHE